MNNKARISFFLLFTVFLVLRSCALIITAPTPDTPLPRWFYPDRIEAVHYVYFPDYLVYYDLSARNYLYLENRVWARVNVLPQHTVLSI